MNENGRWFMSYWDPAYLQGDVLVSQLSSYFSSLFPLKSLKRPVCLAVFSVEEMDWFQWMSMVEWWPGCLSTEWSFLSFFMGSSLKIAQCWAPPAGYLRFETVQLHPPTLQLAKSTKMRQEQRWVRDPERHQSSRCNREWYPPRHDASGTPKSGGGYV